MLSTLEGSAEVTTISLGLPFQTLATSAYRLRRPILRIDVVGVDRRFQQVRCVERVKSADGFSTIRKLTEVFSLFGNPEQIVSDNGTPFTAHEFGAFCISNGIRHIRLAPYHPSTNGEAKRFVQVFKKALRPQVGNKIDVQAETFRFRRQGWNVEPSGFRVGM